MLIKYGTTTANIKSALKSYRNITFEKNKKFKITDTLQIYSNSVIDLNGASIRRYCSKPIVMTYNSLSTTKYNGVHDVVIKNGTIEGMNGIGYSSSNLTALFHAKNITFENVTFLDSCGSHCLDIVGCQNVIVKNCKFLGYCSNGNDFRESIQIDFAYYGGLPYYSKTAKTYDMTKCDNITIEKCKFDKSPTYPAQYVAIGTHALANDQTYNTNIKILNNTARGNGISSKGYGFFFRILNMKDVLLSGNVVDNYGRFVTIVMPASLCNRDGSTIKCVDYPEKARHMDGIIIKNNTVIARAKNCKYIAYAVWIENKFGVAKNITIDGTQGAPSNAICIKGCENVTIK